MFSPASLQLPPHRSRALRSLRCPSDSRQAQTIIKIRPLTCEEAEPSALDNFFSTGSMAKVSCHESKRGEKHDLCRHAIHTMLEMMAWGELGSSMDWPT